ncbi:MAG: hypothetical protein IJH53_07995 [Oscillospiraceae bacterium]|nr:hypothetical protein [Oscillospiraceae bacterium]
MFKRILPHICLDMAVIFIILWIMDRFMIQILSRETFKIPLLVFLLLVIIESVVLIVSQRKE